VEFKLVNDQALFLLVEDNEDDILLFTRALAKSNIFNPVQVVRTGIEAKAYLEGAGRYSNRHEFPLPSIVLLDLKLPGMDGFQVLSWIRQHPCLRPLRVIVLTTSKEIRDVNLAYQLGANSFLEKPRDLEDLGRLVQVISGYWIRHDRAPEVARPDRHPQLERFILS
jgi:CheY-like chemotaxis protein